MQTADRLPAFALRLYRQASPRAHVLGVGLTALAVLAVFASLTNLSQLHIISLNDQAGYITVARSFADRGVLDSSLIYPSMLYQNFSRNYLYMPGHYLALAAAYKLLGYGVFSTLLPNLTAYVLTSLCVFLIGRRVYGPGVGWLAALFFMLFPANLYYTFSAMSEPTVVAASTLAICLGLYLPPRQRWWLAPPLVLLPFLFRETGALTVIPLATFFLRDTTRPRLWRVLVFAVLSAGLIVLFYSSDLVQDRPNLRVAMVLDDSYQTVYQDAVRHQALNSASVGTWVTAIVNRVLFNFGHLLTSNRFRLVETLTNYAIVSGLLLSTVYGVLRRDLFALGAAGMAGGIFGLLVTLYAVSEWRGVRMMLFAVPLLVIVAAVVYVREVVPRLTRRWPGAVTAAHWLIVAALLAAGLAGRGLHRRLSILDGLEERHLAFVEALDHPDDLVLVAPIDLAIGYVHAHYPVKWSFLPYNRETLALLADRYPIGTIVLPLNDPYEPVMPTEHLVALGFELQQKLHYNGIDYLVFRTSALPR